jgi:hypothetical protein
MRTPSLVTAAACAAAVAVALGASARTLVGRDATHVVAVHAGGGDVPSNLLRVYVELSAPMEPGEAYGHIRVVDDSGHEVRGALLELREELWSPDHRRLTLLFDPGRVKRGIRSNVEMGPPLVAGRRYRLVIDSAWRDARNRPLAASYEQELRVSDFDGTSPDPSRWMLSRPGRVTREPLRADFGEPLDHALALRYVTVVDARGARIAGRAMLSDDDRTWTFTPDVKWGTSEVALRVDPQLEDLAGNNLTRPFDSDRDRGEKDAERAIADTAPRLVRVELPSRH